jgi:cytochrome b subunit of formate dehydrogenase
MGETKGILRFPLARRVEHWTLVTAFTVLAATGLPQKYGQWRVSEFALRLLGGLETARVLHRIAAVALILLAIYHFGTLLYDFLVRRSRPYILPQVDDARNAWQQLLFNMGLIAEKPRQGWFTFEEKFEYWALIWGTAVMVLTGFFLWNPITATRLFSGEWIPAAKAAHGGEALLAVLSIVLWHLYHVLIKHKNKSMFTGYLSAEEMEEEHPLALSEQTAVDYSGEGFLLRRKRFFQAYGAVAAAMLLGVAWLVSAERTAVSAPGQIPDLGRVSGYAPLTPTPFPTLAISGFDPSEAGTTWENGIGAVLVESCGLCHQGAGSPGNLDLLTYAGALGGGDSGPAVVPGAPGISLVVIWPQRSSHPGRLSPDQLSALLAWIEAGAPEQ